MFSKMFIPVIGSLLSAVIGYIFSLHVEFINVKAKVFEHDKGIESIYKKLDSIENILWTMKKP